jgi:ATP/maltotriose-dependent transcriptional regulator MalT
MDLWLQVRRVLGSRRAEKTFFIEQTLVDDVRCLAEQEQRTEDDIANELLANALAQRQLEEIHLRCWKGLSTREQQVTALVCLEYTNQQIGSRLFISRETVKTHMRNIQRKFGMQRKSDLRHCLANWDFRPWIDNSSSSPLGLTHFRPMNHPKGDC